MTTKTGLTVVILLVIFLASIYILWPYFDSIEFFENSPHYYFDALKGPNAITKINNSPPPHSTQGGDMYTKFLTEFDKTLDSKIVSEYNDLNKKDFVFKRCYNFSRSDSRKKYYAEDLLENNNSMNNILNFVELLKSEITPEHNDICIHKYIKYTSSFNDVKSSITSDIINFHNCKLKNGEKIKGNVYFLIGQIPYLIDKDKQTISVTFNSSNYANNSYYNEGESPENRLNGQVIYIYYIIYSMYNSRYEKLPSNNFENIILPKLDNLYASADNACKTFCKIDDTEQYYCGCISTEPQINPTTKKLNIDTIAVSQKLGPLLNDSNIIDYNKIYEDNAIGSESNQAIQANGTNSISSCPNYLDIVSNITNVPTNSLNCDSSFNGSGFFTTCQKQNSQNEKDKNIYINKLQFNKEQKNSFKPYSARCTRDVSTINNINTENLHDALGNYMTLYLINKNRFMNNNESIFELP